MTAQPILVPRGIQRRRTKGWRLPAGAVCVDRSTIYGNPFAIDGWARKGYVLCERARVLVISTANWTTADLESVYRAWLTDAPIPWPFGERLDADLPRPPTRAQIEALRGRDLACWCAPDAAWCHRNVLLELANS